jgi:hypothetical protein
VLRAVRVVLNLAVRWGVIASAPKMTLLRAERQRDRVVTQEEEARYIAAAGGTARITGYRPCGYWLEA